MKKLIFSLLTIVCIAFGQNNFQGFIAALNSISSDSLKMKMIDSFMIIAKAQGIPYIEDSTANFVYRGNGTNVFLAGDMNYWSSNSDRLTKVSGTNFFYHSRVFELNARIDYKFVVDGNWILDPNNPRTCPGGFGPNSELAMPSYVQPPEIKYYPEIPHGSLFDTTLFSTFLNNSRTIRIYTPPNYNSSSDSFGIIIMHDGLEYVSLASMHNVLDYLIHKNEIEPIIAVFIPPVNRTQEYAGNQITQFSQFVVNEVLPYIERKYRIKKSPQFRAVAGASNGGNISLYLALNYPNIFGNVAAQSSNVISAISNGFQNSQRLNLKVYLDIGKYDIPQLIPLVRNLRSILQSKGYDMIYAEYPEGHSWGFWRAHIDDYLKFFFPRLSTGVKEDNGNLVPQKIKLYQNYPNPFNNSSKINFDLFEDGYLEIKLFDTLGKEIKEIIRKNFSKGFYQIEISEFGLTSGVYFINFNFQLNITSNERIYLTKKVAVVR